MLATLALAATLLTAAPADPNIVGDWVYDTENWVFRADGTGKSVDDPKFTYEADGKKVRIVYGPDDEETFTYKRDGEKLLLVVDGETLPMTNRAAKSTAPPAKAPKKK